MLSNQDLKDGALAVPLNVSETVYRAIQTGLCTYHDLRTWCGLESAMNIIEISQVTKYNEDKLRYIAEQEAKLRGNNG